jgi:hypothetical protein
LGTIEDNSATEVTIALRKMNMVQILHVYSARYYCEGRWTQTDERMLGRTGGELDGQTISPLMLLMQEEMIQKPECRSEAQAKQTEIFSSDRNVIRYVNA